MAPLEVVQRSDTGRVRSNNEDAVAVDPALGLIVLADGIGGHRAGEIASRIAVESVIDSVKRDWAGPPSDSDPAQFDAKSVLLRKAVQHANEQVLRSARNRPDRMGMGTTIVACLIDGDRLSVAYAGDSRLYVYDGQRLEQITRDHSLVEEMTASGQYSPDAARRMFPRNVVTRALGVESQIQVDLIERKLSGGDLVLLCSDGLSDMLDSETIAATLARAKGEETLDVAVNELVDAANARGGLDNISLALARVTPAGVDNRGWRQRLGDYFRA